MSVKHLTDKPGYVGDCAVWPTAAVTLEWGSEQSCPRKPEFADSYLGGWERPEWTDVGQPWRRGGNPIRAGRGVPARWHAFSPTAKMTGAKETMSWGKRGRRWRRIGHGENEDGGGVEDDRGGTNYLTNQFVTRRVQSRRISGYARWSRDCHGGWQTTGTSFARGLFSVTKNNPWLIL